MEQPRARCRSPNAKQDAQGLLAADCKSMQIGQKENKKCLKGRRGTEKFFHNTILAQAICNEQLPSCSAAIATPSYPALFFITRRGSRSLEVSEAQPL